MVGKYDLADWLPMADWAAMHNRHLNTVRRYVNSGSIAHQRVGQRILIHRDTPCTIPTPGRKKPRPSLFDPERRERIKARLPVAPRALLDLPLSTQESMLQVRIHDFLVRSEHLPTVDEVAEAVAAPVEDVRRVLVRMRP